MLSKKRRLLIVGISVGVAAATFLGLVLIPVPQQFSIPNAIVPDLYTCTGIDTTVGTTIGFHWSAASSITFYAVNCSANGVAYVGNGWVRHDRVGGGRLRLRRGLPRRFVRAGRRLGELHGPPPAALTDSRDRPSSPARGNR